MAFAGNNFPEAFPLPIPQSSGSLFLLMVVKGDWLR